MKFIGQINYANDAAMKPLRFSRGIQIERSLFDGDAYPGLFFSKGFIVGSRIDYILNRDEMEFWKFKYGWLP